MKQRILFVDDDPDLLSGLRRSLRKQRAAWDMFFVESPREALELARKIELDAIVADMRMPGRNGIELLTDIAQQNPTAIRMILTGHADKSMIMRSVGIVHQQLNKPCDTATLVDALSRALALRNMLADDSLRSLVTGTQSLPSMPRIYRELSMRLQDDEASAQEIGELIAEDPPMTAKLLHLVNSAFFGIGRRIANPTEAVLLLGLNTLQGLVLSAGLYSQFEVQQPQSELELLGKLWHHSARVGALARRIAEAEGLNGIALEDCLTGGLLHDIGRLILRFELHDRWLEVQERIDGERIRDIDAERAVLGTDHGVLGAYLLGLWALPTPIVEAVAYHNCPTRSPHRTFCALTAVHVANALDNGNSAVDTDYLESLGLLDRLPVWKELAVDLPREHTDHDA